ncbi:hypothetical protein AX774_g1489 [Zancudomyces culisetae]|uniref:Uncharacterized protein n=1 Tax=Zancudomyces culisetae TaxID=1213189 RepID=A0A1R1PVJ0_ZANCU|nr:hypothetical protein AX774_g1489 [Zancudomyces culisetae]|eukprot:OMH84980.1 hypothetical protein AX774_g1489 [Zancudomyces culisetae]
MRSCLDLSPLYASLGNTTVARNVLIDKYIVRNTTHHVSLCLLPCNSYVYEGDLPAPRRILGQKDPMTLDFRIDRLTVLINGTGYVTDAGFY